MSKTISQTIFAYSFFSERFIFFLVLMKKKFIPPPPPGGGLCKECKFFVPCSLRQFCSLDSYSGTCSFNFFNICMYCYVSTHVNIFKPPSLLGGFNVLKCTGKGICPIRIKTPGELREHHLGEVRQGMSKSKFDISKNHNFSVNLYFVKEEI